MGLVLYQKCKKCLCKHCIALILLQKSGPSGGKSNKQQPKLYSRQLKNRNKTKLNYSQDDADVSLFSGRNTKQKQFFRSK